MMICSLGNNAGRLLVSATLVAASCLLLANFSDANTEQVAAGYTKLPALFNFTAFQQHFGKAYSSRLEAVSRKAYYLASAFRVYVAGLAYRHRRLSHYLALNHMSDWSPREREMMINKRLAGDDSSKTTVADFPPITPQEADNPEMLADELERSIQEKLAENHIEHALDQSSQADESEPTGRAKRARRQKRAVPKRNRRKGQRRLNMDMLVQRNKPLTENARAMAKMAFWPQSNNPLHAPLDVTSRSGGLKDQQEKLNFWRLKDENPEIDSIRTSLSQIGWPSISDRIGGLKEYLSDTLANVLFQADSIDLEMADEPEDGMKEDGMIRDLYQTGCLLKPRHQGQCGSCYAFAAIALAEFLFCKKTGHLYAFSEQYMIDCGKGKVKGLGGCSGSFEKEPASFIHNFGLELRDKYPYAAKEMTCPYPDDTDLKRTGYIRMELRDFFNAPVRKWSEILKETPIYVNVATTSDFDQYAGGVDSGHNCGKWPTHAMLVVGEGRQDGQEYWLFRNSYGTSWGEVGHWKLSKSAPERCITNQMGFVWGTRDLKNFDVDLVINRFDPRVF